jgi:alcohol dehydrogenase (NADP+)
LKVGKNVTKFYLCDFAGVGCLVNSGGECEYYSKGDEQCCEKRILTYRRITP